MRWSFNDEYITPHQAEGESLSHFLLAAARQYKLYRRHGGKLNLNLRKPNGVHKVMWPGLKNAVGFMITDGSYRHIPKVLAENEFMVNRKELFT